MKLSLKNIGPLEECNINIDGLTVITGLNSTGKTTIGKALYSIISSTEDLQESALKDKIKYAFSILYDVIGQLQLYRIIEKIEVDCETIKKAISMIYENNKFSFISIFELYDFVEKFKYELEKINIETLTKEETNKLRIPSIVQHFVKIKEVQVIKINELIDFLQSDKDLIRYTNYRIQKTLDVEFNNQICKLDKIDGESNIRLYDENNTYFDIKLKKNKLNLGNINYFYTNFKNAIFLDDVHILDSLTNSVSDNESIIRYRSHFMNTNMKEFVFFENLSQTNHSLNLLKKLRQSNHNIYSEMFVSESLKPILEKINEVLPSDIYLSKGKFVYSKDELDIRNLATGMKIYSIIKILLQNGQLSKDTLLVLDEPEAHLHPKWQNIFAEIIAIMAKDLGMKIILTTHSPNFLLAIDTYVRKYSIKEKTNFYKSSQMNSMYKVKNINDTIDESYAELSKPFLEMENLYLKLINKED